MRCLLIIRQAPVVAVEFVVPCQATFDEFTIEEQIRQLIKRIVNRRVDVCNRPVVLVLTMRHESDHLARGRYLLTNFGGVVAERLAAFRCVYAVESEPDGFLVCGQNVRWCHRPQF